MPVPSDSVFLVTVFSFSVYVRDSVFKIRTKTVSTALKRSSFSLGSGETE